MVGYHVSSSHTLHFMCAETVRKGVSVYFTESKVRMYAVCVEGLGSTRFTEIGQESEY